MSGRGIFGSGVGSAKGTVVVSTVSFGWGRSSLVVAGQSSDSGGTVVVVGEEVVGSVASGTRMGAGSRAPSVAGFPLAMGPVSAQTEPNR